MTAQVEDGKLEDGIGVLATEAMRVKEFGFSASAVERAKTWMAAFYERAGFSFVRPKGKNHTVMRRTVDAG